MRFLLAALAASMAAACSPEYNWREVRSTEQGYLVMLPGKPATMTRTIRLDSLEVPMTMQGARVGEASFTVAVAALPSDDPATRAAAVASMRAGMLQNIGGTEREAVAVRVPVVDGAGARLGDEHGVRVDADGRVREQKVTMRAGFASRGDRAYQWVALGPSLDDEQARTFLGSFRLTPAVP
ncbi:MAG: hypothetical protein ACLGII_14865 [Gammaproteobacteria bacterium]|jgi:hypothetical protein